MDRKDKEQLIKLFQSFLDVLVPALESLVGAGLIAKYPTSRKLAHLAENISLIKNQLEQEVSDGKVNQPNSEDS